MYLSKLDLYFANDSNPLLRTDGVDNQEKKGKRRVRWPLLRFCKQAYQFPFPKITPKTRCKHGWFQFSFVWLTIRAEY